MKALEPVRLTSLSSCAGCAAKLSHTMLADVLKRLGRTHSAGKNVLVDASKFDDAGVYQLRPDVALVQTVDFFTPIVDDPFAFGQIAATNALSDVYAMGGRPITALNLLGVPADKIGPDAIARILKGGAAKTSEAACALIGGHTIKTLEPIYGLSVTGTVHPKKMLTNARARPGDLLVLTKPLGTGIITTAIKRGLASPALQSRVTQVMTRLNTPGADLAEAGLVQCATDVTGFGLTGHLGNILRASGVRAEINIAAVPAIAPQVAALIDQGCVPGGTANNLQAAEGWVDWGDLSASRRVLMADAQTSGPLLLCVSRKKLSDVLAVLKSHRPLAAAVIGEIKRGTPRILMR
ncbi:MAG: Selenide, water dikinase [Phycisphaerales bacterium]|nr:Selenide, water dikinase [Phycisphaerales bacterium]